MTLVDYLNTQDLAKRPSHLPNAPAGTIIGMASGVPQDVAPLVSAAAPTYSGALNNGLVSPSLPLQNPVNSEFPNIPPVTQPSFMDIANAKMPTVSNSAELPDSIKVDSGNANIEKMIEPTYNPGNINADSMGSAYLNGQGVAYSTGNEDLGGGVEIDNDGYVVINGVRSEYKVTKNEPTSTETPKMDFEQWYQNTKKNAETDRQKAVVNARNNYEHSLSAYGSNAAKLGNMGLTDSGYTKYLDSQAYAQMRADQNAAAATKAATIADADAKYTEYLDTQETTRKNAYSSILSEIDNYTDAQIDALGKQFGFSSPEISALKTARTDAIKQEASTAGVESFKDDDGNLKPKNEVQAEIDRLTAAGVDTANVQKTFDSLYKVYTKDSITFNQDGGLMERAGTKGNNISLTGRGDKKYRVQYSGEKGDANVKAVAQNLPANTVFMYNGVVYLKYSNGECYGIEARPHFGWEKHYNELVKELKGETTT